MARFTGGVSPSALSQAYIDWFQHLAFSPDKQMQLAARTTQQWARYLEYFSQACADPSCNQCIEPLPNDKRFTGEVWQKWPFNALFQGFLLTEQWWHDATTGIAGISIFQKAESPARRIREIHQAFDRAAARINPSQR